ncbi:MAG: hypothetical protein WDM76_00610 [Limisphaerales bacterium]
MKNDTITTVLNLVLGLLALAGVWFALMTILHTRDFRSLQFQATQANNSILQIQAIANEAAAYNQKYPSAELTKLLQPAPAKPAAR